MSDYSLKKKIIKGKDLFGNMTTHGIELTLIDDNKKQKKIEVSEKQSEILIPFINQLIWEIDTRDQTLDEIRSMV